MQARQRSSQVGIPLVRAHDETARLGDREVHARQASLGRQKPGPQFPPRRFGQVPLQYRNQFLQSFNEDRLDTTTTSYSSRYRTTVRARNRVLASGKYFKHDQYVGITKYARKIVEEIPRP